MNTQPYNVSISFIGEQLIINEGLYQREISFSSKIKQIENFDSDIVVRIRPQSENFINGNVF